MKPLVSEEIDLSGIPGYVRIKGEYTYFVLHQEIIDGRFTGCYLKEYISKEQFDMIRGERDAKAKKAIL